MKYLVWNRYDKSFKFLISAKNTREVLTEIISKCDDKIVDLIYDNLEENDIAIIELDNVKEI